MNGKGDNWENGWVAQLLGGWAAEQLGGQAAGVKQFLIF